MSNRAFWERQRDDEISFRRFHIYSALIFILVLIIPIYLDSIFWLTICVIFEVHCLFRWWWSNFIIDYISDRLEEY